LIAFAGPVVPGAPLGMEIHDCGDPIIVATNDSVPLTVDGHDVRLWVANQDLCSGPATTQALPDGPIIQWISEQGFFDIVWTGQGAGIGVVLLWDHIDGTSTLRIEDAGVPGAALDEFQEGSEPGDGPVWWQTFDLGGGRTLVYGFATNDAKSIEIHAGGETKSPTTPPTTVARSARSGRPHRQRPRTCS
jgi:hypothetical protein